MYLKVKIFMTLKKIKNELINHVRHNLRSLYEVLVRFTHRNG